MDNRRFDERVVLANTPALIIDRKHLVTYEATVHDYSRSGCCVASNQVFDFPDEVVVQIRDLDRTLVGRVVWRRNGRAGIQFEWRDETSLRVRHREAEAARVEASETSSDRPRIDIVV